MDTSDAAKDKIFIPVDPVYSNIVEIHALPWDITMVFGQIKGMRSQDDGTAVPLVVARSVVVMSPTHAKAFWTALGKNIREYEENFGTVQLPPSDGGSRDKAVNEQDATSR